VEGVEDGDAALLQAWVGQEAVLAVLAGRERAQPPLVAGRVRYVVDQLHVVDLVDRDPVLEDYAQSHAVELDRHDGVLVGVAADVALLLEVVDHEDPVAQVAHHGHQRAAVQPLHDAAVRLVVKHCRNHLPQLHLVHIISVSSANHDARTILIEAELQNFNGILFILSGKRRILIT